MLRQLLSLIGAEGALPSTLPPGFSFLFKLAWESKVRLPILIAVAFMLTDYHLQLEINVDVRIQEEEIMIDAAPDQQHNQGNNNDVGQLDIVLEEVTDEEEEEDEMSLIYVEQEDEST